MTTAQIVDIILPLTKEDNKCGFKKTKKLRARNEMIVLINDYRDGKAVELPDEVLMLIAQF
jgi:hypothetical protein